MITDRTNIARYLHQEVVCTASYGYRERHRIGFPPLRLIMHIRLKATDEYTNHLWVMLPKDAGLVPGQRFTFRGVVVPYMRSDDLSDSVTISRIEILRDN